MSFKSKVSFIKGVLTYLERELSINKNNRILLEKLTDISKGKFVFHNYYNNGY